MGRAGKHDEFTRFVTDTSPSLKRSALLLTGDRELADDLVQATYTKLFVVWGRVQRAGNPMAYARTTLTNTYLSHLRLRRNAEVPSADPEATPPSADAGPDDRLDVVAALRTLTPLDRAVLVLRYWEDRSVAETAHQLGLSDTAVRTRSRRALIRLRPLIRPFQEEIP